MSLTKPTAIDGELLDLPVTPSRYIAIETGEEAQAVYEQLRAATYVSFDTETSGLGRQASVFGITFTLNGFLQEVDKRKWYLPGNTYWYRFGLSDEADEIMMDALRYMFSNEGDLGIIMHNGKFDMVAVQNTFGIVFERQAFNDTMIMAQVLARFSSAGLKSLCAYVLQKSHGWDSIVDTWFARQKRNLGKVVKGSNAVKRRKRGDDKDYADIPEAIIFPYACTDAEYTFELFFQLREVFRKERADLQTIYKLERSIVPVTAAVEYKGLCLDMLFLTELANEITETVNVWYEEFVEMWGQPDPHDPRKLLFNPGSPKQMAEVLYGKDRSRNQLGLPVIERTPTGQPKTGGDVLEKLMQHDERVGQIVRYQRCTRALATIQQLLELAIRTEHGSTIHTDYFQVLVSGRFSSRNPNLQNLINDDRGGYRNILPGGGDISVRRGFVAPPGYLYVKADYSAFELRWIANASKDPKLIAMLKSGVDLHSWLGAKLYKGELDGLRAGYDEQKLVESESRWKGVPVPGDQQDLRDFSPAQLAAYNDTSEGDWHYDKVHHDANAVFVEHCPAWDASAETEFAKQYELDWRYFAIKSKSLQRLKEMRTNVKVCSFAIVYGAGVKRISETFNVPAREAEALRDIYFRSFPVLDSWRRQVNADTDRTKLVYTLFGRKRVLQPTDYVGTTAVNHIIQGTAADWLKFSMLDIHNVLKGYKSYMCATIHDEVQIYLHHTEIDVMPYVIGCMEKERAPELMPIKMLAEVSASKTTWADCKELDNSKPLVPQLELIWNGRL